MPKICHDAGHNFSGGDTGAEGNGYREQDVTHMIASTATKYARQCGFEVKETRESFQANVGRTVSESINGRVAVANNFGAGICVSFHLNACDDKSANGIETLIYKFGGSSEKLARLIHKELLETLGLRDRGIKERTNLGILKNTNMPACLCEIGFITNPADARIVNANVEKIGQAIARAECKYFGIAYNDGCSVLDCTNELKWRGIITDQDLWTQRGESDGNIKALFQKYYPYIRTNGGSVKGGIKEIGYALNVLAKQGIVTDRIYWEKKAGQDSNVKWLLIKMADYIN